MFCYMVILKSQAIRDSFTAWKLSKYGVFSGLCFPVFGLNAEIYGVNLHIQSEDRKIRTRKNSVFGYFPRSDFVLVLKLVLILDFESSKFAFIISRKLLWLGGTCPFRGLALFKRISAKLFSISFGKKCFCK